LWLALFVTACTSSSPSSPSTITNPSCPAPTEPNSRRLIDFAAVRPPWVEIEVALQVEEPGFDFTRFQNADSATRDRLIAERKAQLAPLYAPIRERLTAIDARKIQDDLWLTPTIFATVRAEHVAAIPCWPKVVAVTGNTILCTDTCMSACAVKSLAECGTCTARVGQRLDAARRCIHAPSPVACGDASTADVLTCYVREPGDMFVLRDATLIDRGANLRLCTREEADDLNPATLPACPL
jgi:hypothetical protein